MKNLLLEPSQPPVAIAIVVIGMNWTSLLIPDNIAADMKTRLRKFHLLRLLSAGFPPFVHVNSIIVLLFSCPARAFLLLLSFLSPVIGFFSVSFIYFFNFPIALFRGGERSWSNLFAVGGKHLLWWALIAALHGSDLFFYINLLQLSDKMNF